MSNLSLGSGFLAVVTSKAHLIHVGSPSGRATRTRIRRVVRERVKVPTPGSLRPFGLPAFASWIFLFPPGTSASLAVGLPSSGLDLDGVSTLRTSKTRLGWAPPPSTPGPAVSSLRAQLPEGRLALPSAGSCDRRQHAIDAALKSRGIIKGSLAFARPAFPSSVAPRWPGRSWA